MRKTLLALGLAMALGTAHAAEPVSQAQFDALQARISQLEGELAELKASLPKTATATTRGLAAPVAKTDAGADADLAAPDADLAAPDADLASPEAVAAGTSTPEAPASDLASADGASSGASANAFNPAITIILNGSYSHHSLDPDAYVRAGFPLAGEAGPSPNGFSLGESEMSFAANIDDKLYGQLSLAAESEDGEDHISVEEAFIDTTSLPGGFSLRAGRFFSNIGYLNSHHAHTDNFFDRPLAYQAFLGSQYGDDGVQLRWVAPTPLFLEFGGELFRGDAYPAGGAGHGGVGTRSVFAHAGGDVGNESSWLAGVSALRTRAEPAEDGFVGDGTLYVADGTWKWAPQGNFKDGGITLRSEYFVDRRDGAFLDPTDSTLSTLWSGERSGAYLEGVYRFNRTWDVGYRYDKLWAAGDGPLASDFDPYRHSAMLTWRNSEFSLVRVQVSHDKPNAADSDNAVTLQYQTSLGAHGAHKF